MARLAILEYPDPRLHEAAAPVVAFDAALAGLIDDLFETLYATSGIGLSAPQVGVLRRVSVMDLSADRSEPQVFVNPEITARARWGLVEESCLSVPGVVANVVRATRVTVHARDRAGEAVERALEDMHAVCIQHEADHLAGKLFIDRLSLPRRLHARARARAHARRTATAAAPRAESA